MSEAAIGPEIDPEIGYVVEKLGRGLYLINNGAYQMMFLTTGEGLIVVDAPPFIGSKILEAIATVTDEPITHVIYSHSHNDHIGSASLYPDGVEIIAHEETAAHLVKKNDPNRPIPTRTFSDELTLTVGTQTLKLTYNGLNHTPGNIYIYALEQKVLMLVDIIFPGWTPFEDLAIAESVAGFLEAHDVALSYDFDYFIGGHQSRYGTRQDVETQKAYFNDTLVAAEKANAAMDFGAALIEAEARGGKGNPWVYVKIMLDKVTAQCAAEVEKKWSDRLGGVDIYTYSHCWEITGHQRVD
ncbi:MBL fold metallo-hydrolase [Flexibacterium corallicola]|uniref:MBL fold metallo-hydrolase n=1 Tax=Flexibacterium corallicola TaxID=3037259 RepID=UPI00286F3646|nr:MBL fold metallo-hydrolase [Pseudovibrio sp. M1P-2-3]